MSGHTPGPWSVIEHSWSHTGIYAGPHVLAELDISGYATEENQTDLEAETSANARLMAAAPELLASLKAALTILIDSVGDFDHEAATSAINKATQP